MCTLHHRPIFSHQSSSNAASPANLLTDWLIVATVLWVSSFMVTVSSGSMCSSHVLAAMTGKSTVMSGRFTSSPRLRRAAAVVACFGAEPESWEASSV